MSGHGGGAEVPHGGENDPFVKRVALSVAVFAVVLALAAAGGKKAANDTMMGQLQASNEWARYQAKVQRQVGFTQEQEQLELKYGLLKEDEAKGLAKEYEEGRKARKEGKEAKPADDAARGRQRLAFVAHEVERYEHDKKELTENAKKFEGERELAHKRDPYFEASELLLQIGIVLASVAMLSKARWAFYTGAVLGVLGLLLTVNGYTLLVELPFLGGGHAPAPGAGH